MRIKGSTRPPGEPKQIRAIVTLEQLAPYPHAHSGDEFADPFRVRGRDLPVLALIVLSIIALVQRRRSKRTDT